MKTSLIHRSVMAVACILGTSVCAQAQLTLSLKQAQDLGVDRAYAMQRARIDVDVAKRDVKELLATSTSMRARCMA